MAVEIEEGAFDESDLSPKACHESFADDGTGRDGPDEADIQLGQRHCEHSSGAHRPGDTDAAVEHGCHDATLHEAELVGSRFVDGEPQCRGPRMVIHFDDLTVDTGHLNVWWEQLTHPLEQDIVVGDRVHPPMVEPATSGTARPGRQLVRSSTREAGALVSTDRIPLLRPLFNFGRLNAQEFVSGFKAAWDVGSGRPQFSIEEVLAVRGQRLAVIVDRTDFGDDMRVDLIGINQLDRTLRLQRVTSFDVDDSDAAIAELDRLHAEIDD